MPILSKFYGIIIYVYWEDHNPPHFHARYCDYEIVMEIESGKHSGEMPLRALRLIQQWRRERNVELKEAWVRAENREVLKPIRPLE